MNEKMCKRLRGYARLIAKEKQSTTWTVAQIPAGRMGPKGRARWANKGWAPQIWVSPDCARGIYLQLKGDV